MKQYVNMHFIDKYNLQEKPIYKIVQKEMSLIYI